MMHLSRRSVVLLAIVASLYGFLWIAGQANPDLDTQDVFWYLNRAQLYWRGEIEGLKHYNPFYPLVLGSVNVLVGQIVLSAVILNIGIFVVWCVGMYWLVSHYTHRHIAVITLLILVTHEYFVMFLRQMQTMLLFITFLVWLAIAVTHFVNSPNYRYAFWMGVVVVCATLTRLEGIYFGIFILLGIGTGYRTRSLIQNLKYLLISLLPVALVLPFYLLRIFTAELVGGESLFIALRTTSTPLAFVAKSIFRDVSLVVAFWFAGLWLLTLLALSRVQTRFWRVSVAVVGIFLYHISVLFISTQTTIVGSRLYFLSMLMYSAYLIGWGIWALGNFLGMKWLVWGITVMIVLTNLWTTWQSEKIAPLFAFMQDTYAQDAQVIDEWLITTEVDHKKIYTLCYNILGYTTNPIHYIYRYATSANDANQWDAPQNLLPRMVEQDALFMTCDFNLYPEWTTFLNGEKRVGIYRLESIGIPTKNYQFYRAVREN
jgi:hypothetical protein